MPPSVEICRERVRMRDVAGLIETCRCRMPRRRCACRGRARVQASLNWPTDDFAAGSGAGVPVLAHWHERADAVRAFDRPVAAVATTVATKDDDDMAAYVDNAMLLHYVEGASQCRRALPPSAAGGWRFGPLSLWTLARTRQGPLFEDEPPGHQRTAKSSLGVLTKATQLRQMPITRAAGDHDNELLSRQ